MSQEKATEDRKHEIHALLFHVRRSRRYHAIRVRALHRMRVLRLVLISLSSSSTFVAALNEAPQWVIVAFSSAIAVFGTAELVTQAEDRRRLYEKLGRQFAELESRILKKRSALESGEQNQLDRFIAKNVEIEIKEPPPSRTLNDICHNQQVVAEYAEKEDRDKYLIKVSRPRRLWASVWNLGLFFDDQRLSSPHDA